MPSSSSPTTAADGATTTTVAAPIEEGWSSSSSTSSSSNDVTIAEKLNALDETLSKPLFFLGLPRWIELAFSVPANLFGTTAGVVVGPSWIALAALSSSSANYGDKDEVAAVCYADDDDDDARRRILLLKALTAGTTLAYLVAWMWFFQIRKRVRDLATKVFWNETLFLLAYPWSVGVLMLTVGGLTPPEAAAAASGCRSPGDVLSIALYPLVLSVPAMQIVQRLKRGAGRYRPARKDRDRWKSAAISRKSFPTVTWILAEHDGTKSFPSGDALMATIMAIPFWEALGWKGTAVAIAASSALGRMYVLAHHLSDVTAGFGVAVAVHGLLETIAEHGLLGTGGIRGTAWWHPLLLQGAFCVWSRITDVVEALPGTTPEPSKSESASKEKKKKDG